VRQRGYDRAKAAKENEMVFERLKSNIVVLAVE
jgi:hypothetical protein